MSDKFSSKDYRIEKPEKWWEKDINPTISFIFLIGAMIAVFGMGAIFMREYTTIWHEISNREKQVYLIDQIKSPVQPDKGVQFEDIVIP
ncbi:hypothetical protein KKG58_04695 [Patescibacteria group bacterium]|nr:hypothetical protein [Patescibacteria group bacterium]